MGLDSCIWIASPIELNLTIHTKRNLMITRLNEHRTRQSSEVCKYLMENPKHSVNFDSPTILDRSNYSAKLRIKETLHIAKRQPQLNVNSQSLSLFLFNA